MRATGKRVSSPAIGTAATGGGSNRYLAMVDRSYFSS
jgi:hypothetical protein